MAVCTQDSGYFGKYASYFCDFPFLETNKLQVIGIAYIHSVTLNQFTTALDALPATGGWECKHPVG
jgi:hypothetical protein